jgi:hypothetical protein
VGLVPEPDRLEPLNTHHVTNRTTGEQFLEPGRIVGVAQDVTDPKEAPAGFGRGNNRAAAVRVRSHRLLEQDMVAQTGENLGGFPVECVLIGDDDHVRNPALVGEFTPIVDNETPGNSVLSGDPVPVEVARVGNGHHLRKTRILEDKLSVAAPTASGTDNRYRDRFHERMVAMGDHHVKFMESALTRELGNGKLRTLWI